ncbi:MAG: hypothetical protein H0U29_02860 [Acidimicrobiia bacterium]|nr:hypothetical protein [Acidimicrobiia bacterium]
MRPNQLSRATAIRTGPRRRPIAAVCVAIGLLAAACTPSLQSPGKTSKISLVSSTTSNGYRFDFYRNTAYPCSISGYQTFTIATRVGSSATATKPLWVYMRGGGVGYFDDSGQPLDGGVNMTEESAAFLQDKMENVALTRLMTQQPAGYRALAVSMCNRDVYGGPDIADPNNPNTTPDGRTRTVNGLFATKAAVQFTLATYPTDDYFLYGASAGSAGAFHVAWALQRQGLAPAGIVADSALINEAFERARYEQGLGGRTPDETERIRQRLHSDITAIGNNPDQLVTDGRLTVPVLQVWVINDGGGSVPMVCPLRNGSTATMGVIDCLHEPLRRAIVAQGPSSRSLNMRLCVDNPARAGACDLHVPTTVLNARNTLAGVPADFNPVIVEWVAERLTDD